MPDKCECGMPLAFGICIWNMPLGVCWSWDTISNNIDHIIASVGSLMNTYYLSFATRTKFVGGVYIKEESRHKALYKAHTLGMGEDAQVKVTEVPEKIRIKASYMDRVLTEAEVHESVEPEGN